MRSIYDRFSPERQRISHLAEGFPRQPELLVHRYLREADMNRKFLQHCSAPVLAIILAVALTAGLAGCGKDDSGPTNPNPVPTTTTYTGIVTGNTVSGKLVVTLETAKSTLTAAGAFTPGGSSAISLAGTYDNAAHTFVVTGGDWMFDGSLAASELTGAFTGPSGASGTFTLQQGSTDVTVIIGTFTSTSGSSNGRFNFSISGTTISGIALADGSISALPLVGAYNTSTGAITIQHPAGGAPLATGTYHGDTGAASGSYNDRNGNSGNWSGNKS
jgi:hypothetical protein